jgi:hypothetical protein
MHVVELPVVELSIDLRAAFEAMKWTQRSAVVARRELEFWLAMDVQVVRGIVQERRSLDDLIEKHRLYVPSLEKLAEHAVSLANPFITASRYHTILDEAREDYGLLAAGINYAIVLTRSEELGGELGEPGPKRCACLADVSPPCKGRGNTKGGDCSRGHKGTVHCYP